MRLRAIPNSWDRLTPSSSGFQHGGMNSCDSVTAPVPISASINIENKAKKKKRRSRSSITVETRISLFAMRRCDRIVNSWHRGDAPPFTCLRIRMKWVPKAFISLTFAFTAQRDRDSSNRPPGLRCERARTTARWMVT